MPYKYNALSKLGLDYYQKSTDDSGNEFSTLSVGDVSGGDYTAFSSDGSIRLYGDATQWEDLRVSVEATTEQGSNPPVFSLLKNDGNEDAGSASAITFEETASGGNTTITDTGTYSFHQSYTIEFWFKPTNQTYFYRNIFEKSGSFRIAYWGQGRIYAAHSAIGSLDSGGIRCNIGTWNHIALVVEVGGTPLSQAILYINGVEAASNSSEGSLTSNNNTVQINNQDTIMSLDELVFWNKNLSEAEVLDRYNADAGQALVGNEANVVSAWGFDDSSTSSIVTDKNTTTSNDITLVGVENTDYTWIDGHVAATSNASRGVYTYFFSPDVCQELHFTVQMPHNWKQGTDIHPHLHWIAPESGAAGEKVAWNLEYTWTNIGETFGDTTTIEGSTSLPNETISAYKHYITELGIIDATGKTFSSMLVCRICRRTTSTDDTYTDFAGLLEFDLHYQVDSLGSVEEYTKYN